MKIHRSHLKHLHQNALCPTHMEIINAYFQVTESVFYREQQMLQDLAAATCSVTGNYIHWCLNVLKCGFMSELSHVWITFSLLKASKWLDWACKCRIPQEHTVSVKCAETTCHWVCVCACMCVCIFLQSFILSTSNLAGVLFRPEEVQGWLQSCVRCSNILAPSCFLAHFLRHCFLAWEIASQWLWSLPSSEKS